MATVTIEIPPDLQARVAYAAARHALSVEDYIKSLLEQATEIEPANTSGEPEPFWATASPQDRVAAFTEWVNSHHFGPCLANEALRRENIYEDRL